MFTMYVKIIRKYKNYCPQSKREMKIMKKKFAKLAVLFSAAAVLISLASFADVSHMSFEVSAADSVYEMTKDYRSGKFYKNFTGLTLTGDEAHDTIAIALSQVGYHEGDSQGEMDGESSDGSRDFVEYNVLYGKLDNAQGNGLSYGYYWCASFVNWCLRQAGVGEADSGGAEVSCERWIASCRESGIYNSKSGYFPKSGDMIFFRDVGSSRSATHIGLVLYSDGAKVYTVEGNSSSSGDYSENGEYVALRSYELGSRYIVGYASPRYHGAEKAKRIDHSGNFFTKGEYISLSDMKIYSSSECDGISLSKINKNSIFTVTEAGQGCFKIKQGSKDGYIKNSGSVIQVTTHEKVYKVEYVNENGFPMYTPQYRVSGQEKRVYTNIPEKSKSGFVGWRASYDSSVILSPKDKLPIMDSDIKLTAVWDDKLYSVRFLSADGEVIKEYRGYYGDILEPPEAPSAPEGYVFFGWGADYCGAVKRDASYIVTYISEEELAAVGGESESASASSPRSGCISSAPALPLAEISAAAAIALFSKRKKK